MTDTRDLLWMAGWLEGEGTFDRGVRGASTDKDVIERVAKILNAPVYTSYLPKGGRAHVWSFAIYGGHAASWMMTLFSLMGVRRKSAIRKALGEWKQRKTKRKPGLPPTCHPDRKHLAKGLCSRCYGTLRRAK